MEKIEFGAVVKPDIKLIDSKKILYWEIEKFLNELSFSKPVQNAFNAFKGSFYQKILFDNSAKFAEISWIINLSGLEGWIQTTVACTHHPYITTLQPFSHEQADINFLVALELNKKKSDS